MISNPINSQKSTKITLWFPTMSGDLKPRDKPTSMAPDCECAKTQFWTFDMFFWPLSSTRLRPRIWHLFKIRTPGSWTSKQGLDTRTCLDSDGEKLCRVLQPLVHFFHRNSKKKLRQKTHANKVDVADGGNTLKADGHEKLTFRESKQHAKTLAHLPSDEPPITTSPARLRITESSWPNLFFICIYLWIQILLLQNHMQHPELHGTSVFWEFLSSSNHDLAGKIILPATNSHKRVVQLSMPGGSGYGSIGRNSKIGHLIWGFLHKWNLETITIDLTHGHYNNINSNKSEIFPRADYGN